MRDAFGGAFSIRLMLVFLMLYISFICVAINYARAFRVKNRIINVIEQYEGVDRSGNVEAKISNELLNTGYFVPISEVDGVRCSDCTFNTPGYSYKEIRTNYGAGNTYDTYYYVETYMLFKIPIIDTFLGIDFPIVVKGETRVMNYN